MKAPNKPTPVTQNSHSLRSPLPNLNSNNATSILLKCSTHFLYNVQTFFLLKAIQAKTTPPTTPLFFSFSFPVKTILLFNPTGSARGRLEREWAAGILLLAHCWMLNSPPSLHKPSLSHAWKRRVEEEGRQWARKKNNNHKRRNPHISHIIPGGESSCVPGIPSWFKDSQHGAAGPGWSSSAERTDNAHSLTPHFI